MAVDSKGALLDRQDAVRFQEFIHTPLDEIDLARARPGLLGDFVANLVSKGAATYLEGGVGVGSAGLLPFLYFYPTLCIELCPKCSQVAHPETLEPLLKEGAAIVVMRGPHRKTTKSFQEVAWKYNDSFVGHRSFDLLRQTQMFQDAEAALGEGEDPRIICKNCNKGVVRSIEKRSEGLTNPYRLEVETAMGEIDGIGGPAHSDLVDRLRITLEEARYNDLAPLARTASFARYAGGCRALGAVPQISTSSLRTAELLVDALQIDIPEGMSDREYLELIRPHRGALSPAGIPARPADVLDVAQNINVAVRKIEASHKLRLGQVLAGSVVPQMVSAGVAFATHGVVSHEAGDLVRDLASPERAATPSGVSFLARYFGTPESVIHVWQVRRRLRDS